MRTVRIKIYEFNELNEVAKKAAIKWFQSIGGNVAENWWESVYEDAANIGLVISSSDINKGICEGSFSVSADETAHNIEYNHGVICETYTTAIGYIREKKKMIERGYSRSKIDENIILLDENFLHSLLHDYRVILTQEYDYKTSEEGIIESIVSGEYEFTKEGKIFNL